MQHMQIDDDEPRRDRRATCSDDDSDIDDSDDGTGPIILDHPYINGKGSCISTLAKADSQHVLYRTTVR